MVHATRLLFRVTALTLALTASLEAQEIEIRGRLLDADGRAVTDAELALYPVVGSTAAGILQLEGNYPPPTAAEGRPDEAGRFRSLPPASACGT